MGRVGIAQPLVMAARWALVLGSGLLKRRSYALEVVFTAVPFHEASLSGTEAGEGRE